MPTPRYRAVVVGLGFIGAGDQVSGDAIGGQQVSSLDGTHAGALSRHPSVELVAGSSRDAGRRERFTQRTGVKTYADWREMLERERPDIVSVATYAPQHAPVTIDAVLHGARVVYCEKPVAQNLADAEGMLEACRAPEGGPESTLLVINHNRRFHPAYRKLRDLIKAGGLGDLTSASLQWPGGRLGNVGTHLIDALVMLTGRRVVAVSATLDDAGKPDVRGPAFRDPGGWGVLRLQGNVMATLSAGDFSRAPARIEIHGAFGRATITGRNEVTIERYAGVKDARGAPQSAATETWPAVNDGMTSMDRAVAEIVAWLDHGTPFPYPAADAVHVLEAIVALHASHKRAGAWTTLPLRGEDRNIEVHSG